MDIELNANTGSAGYPLLQQRGVHHDPRLRPPDLFGEHFSLDRTQTTGFAVSTTVDDAFDKKAVSKRTLSHADLDVRIGVGYQF